MRGYTCNMQQREIERKSITLVNNFSRGKIIIVLDTNLTEGLTAFSFCRGELLNNHLGML